MEAEQTRARQCGSCTLCCKVLGVAAFDKPAGAWCRHCRPSQGCMIYQTRPEECRTFGCLWLTNPSFPDELKPERSKLVFVLEAEGNRIIAYCDPGWPLAWKEAPNYRMLKSMALKSTETGRQVVVALRDHFTAILPDRDVPLGEVKPGQRIVYRMAGVGAARRLEPVVE